FGVGRDLRGAERFDLLGDGFYIWRFREGRGDAEKSDGKSRQGKLTTIDIHDVLPLYDCAGSLADTLACVDWSSLPVRHPQPRGDACRTRDKLFIVPSARQHHRRTAGR